MSAGVENFFFLIKGSKFWLADDVKFFEGTKGADPRNWIKGSGPVQNFPLDVKADIFTF